MNDEDKSVESFSAPAHTDQELMMWAIEQIARINQGTGMVTRQIIIEATTLVEGVKDPSKFAFR